MEAFHRGAGGLFHEAPVRVPGDWTRSSNTH